MPIEIPTDMPTSSQLAEVHYDYDYPRGLDLKPGSEFHKKLVTKILTRARESATKMTERHPAWQEIERTLTAYIPPKTKREARLKGDKTMPIIIPMSYATLETLLTYMVAAFLQDPIFSYPGSGPEDLVGGFLLERVVQAQCVRMKVGLNLHTSWRDGFSYGMGITPLEWHTHMGYRRTVKERTMFRKVVSTKRSRKYGVLFEGNKLSNVDPFLYLPDTNVAVQDIQNGEFVGWIDKDTKIRLLGEEGQRGSNLFNVKYLRHITGRSSVYPLGERIETEVVKEYKSEQMSGPVDVLPFYVDLIPNEWDLGTKDRPEKWLFMLAGDQVIIQAHPLNLDHNMFPVAVAAPDYDGYSVTPISRLEISYGMQDIIDWYFTSHVANIRKVVNNLIVADPEAINMPDFAASREGGIIRTRRAHWGKGIDNMIKQLDVRDVTSGHIKDAGVLMEMIQRTTAATDVVAGIRRGGGERVSATEARDVRVSALSRMEKAAKIIGMQSHQDIGYMFGKHTQQFMSEDMKVKLLGDWPEKMAEEYGEGYASVSPDDISVDTDILPHDGSIPGGEPTDLWIQLYQILVTQPEVAAGFDLKRIFIHMARQMGAKNVYDFIKRGVEIKPDEEVLSEADKGNIISIGELG